MSKKIVSGADIIYNTLLKHNVKTIFGYSGGSIMPVFDKLYNSKINKIINSHEQNCGHAATGYAKSSGRTGVVLVTSGPGITNMITPMLDATNDSTPLVVFSGQVNQSAIGSNAFQEAPATQLSQHVTKWSKMVQNVSDLEDTIDRAFFIANHKKKGAVHIDLPKCVTTSQMCVYNIEYNSNTIKKINKEDTHNNKNESNNLNLESLFKVSEKINSSKKPILYVGQGCNNDYKLLREFAQKGNIPVTTTIHACGVMDEDSKLSVGWCGMHGYATANYCLQEADCIIAVGSRFDDRTTGNIDKYAPKARKNKAIIHVNIEPTELNNVLKTDYNFNTTCENFLQNTIKHLAYNPRTPWFNYISNLKRNNKFDYKTESGKLFMENVLTQLYLQTKHLNDNIIFTMGVGNHQMQSYQYIKSHYPNKLFSSGSLGVMGAGLPYAIGSQIANPHKMVICVDGDSSFNMTLTDMKTIVEHNLPIKIAVMNNGSQMMVNIWEKLFFEERYTATINKRNPDFASLAEAYGIHSLKCDNVDTLGTTIEEFINHKGPILCEFKIEKGICLPLVSPGAGLDEMILHKNYNFDSSNIKFNNNDDVPY